MEELEQITNEARDKYRELSLIPLPKMRIIYEKILMKDYDVDNCVDDIGIFLGFPLDSYIRNVIKDCIKVRLEYHNYVINASFVIFMTEFPQKSVRSHLQPCSSYWKLFEEPHVKSSKQHKSVIFS